MLINMKNNFKNQSGQVVLVVMLVSALVLTLGLSASKKATIETKIDTDEQLLKQAFNTAESGIDYYLRTGATQYGDANSATGLANLNVSQVGGSNTLEIESVTIEGNPELLWLMGHATSGELDSAAYYTGASVQVCRQDNVGSGNFKIDYFYKSGATYGVSRNYQAVDGTGCVTITLSNQPVLLAATPIGFSQRLKFNGLASFPVQGEEISSKGTVGSINSTVRVLNKYEVPVFMLEAITSSGNITNN